MFVKCFALFKLRLGDSKCCFVGWLDGQYFNKILDHIHAD